MREIPPGLAEAYTHSLYVIRQAPGRTLTARVGMPSARCAALLTGSAPRLGAIVTADNPFSRQLAPTANLARHARLRDTLQAAGCARLHSLALDPLGRWPPELGFFIPEVSASAVDELLVAFEQFAAVTVDCAGLPTLRWHPRYRDAP